MTTPEKPRHKPPKPVALAAARPAGELAVPVGPRVVEVLELAYRARRPILLEGPTGIGKSQIVAEFARASGIAMTVLDLSLLEPPDLVGLPVIRDGRTHYAAPAELPTGGRGVLMLEELNRAEVPVMQPALQLLSARKLHAYELPAGWICVAAINPEEGDYQVNRLDPALRSRFLQLAVCADRTAWLGWATRTNVHPVVARVVRDHADVFDHASPRSWTYASDVLHALRAADLENRDLVRVALRGYLPTSWSIVVADALASQPAIPALDPEQLFAPGGAAVLARIVKELDAGKRIDAVAMVAAMLRKLFAGDELVHRGVTLAGLEQLVAPLPGDLREQCLESAVESPAAQALLGRDPAELVARYSGSPLAKDIIACRRDLQVYRVRLVVVAVARWLERAQLDDQALEALAPQLVALTTDAGPIAADLAHWLRARGLAP